MKTARSADGAVFGHSSGVVLALTAAAAGSAITKLALYEPPLLVDDSRPRPRADLADQLARLVAEATQWSSRR